MLKLRLFQQDGIRVWLCDGDGQPLRELGGRIGKLPGDVDWVRTAETLHTLGGEGLEFDFVFEEAVAA